MADPDLRIRGRGGERGERGGEGGSGGKRSSRPWDKGRGAGWSRKKFFSALWASVWSKNKRDPPLHFPSTYASTLIPFKPQYPHTNSPNWSLYISLKNELREFDKRSRNFYLADRFINSHNLSVDNVWMLLGGNWSWSLLGLKGLIRIRENCMIGSTKVLNEYNSRQLSSCVFYDILVV